jgi:hypothetical protein
LILPLRLPTPLPPNPEARALHQLFHCGR